MSEESDEAIIEIANFITDFDEIISKYDVTPELHKDLDTVREDGIKLRSMCFYFGPRVSIVESELENLENYRKRRKAGMVRGLRGKIDPHTGKKYVRTAAEDQARVDLEEVDNQIAACRSAANYGKSVLYNIRDLVTQFNECMKSIGNEMRTLHYDRNEP